MRTGSFLRLAGIFLSISLGHGLLASGPSLLNSPPEAQSDSGALVATDKDGRERWRAEWTMERVLLEGQAMVRFREWGAGRYSPFPEPVRWELEAFWTASPRFAPFSYEKKIFGLDGELRVTERRRFDWERSTVHFQRIDSAGKRNVDRVLPVPRDTLTAEGIALALQGLPFEKPHPVKAHFLSDEPKVYQVTFAVGGRRAVKTPAGTVDSFEIKMDLNLGLLNFFKPFIPDTKLWFSAAAPHRWVQYRGLESGRGTPVVTRTQTR